MKMFWNIFDNSRIMGHAPAGMNHALVAVIEQHGSLGKCCFDLVLREVTDVRWAGLEGFGARNRQFFVLLRTRRAANAHSADDLPADADRNAALKRSKAIKGHHRGTALVYDVFKNLGRLLKEKSSARFADRNIRSRGKRAVDPLECHEVAAVIDDGNHASRLLAICFGNRGSNNLARALHG